MLWTIKVWAGGGRECHRRSVDDRSGAVVEAWTGPQVAWKMARGYDGARSAARRSTAYRSGSASALLFLIGLADLRRPLSMRNLDLLVLLSFTVSLWFFNRGDIFTERAARLPAAASTCSGAWPGARVARPTRDRRRCRSGRSGCSAAATVFTAGLPRRPERARLERDRRRLLGRDRRATGS